MNFIDSFKKSWKKGFDYKGKSTRKEFIEFEITDHILRIIIFPVILFITGNFMYLSYERNLTIIPEIITVISQLIKIIQFLYTGGTLFVTTSLTIRCLRNAEAKWQWIFLHFIPFGFILIYFLPLKKLKNKSN